MQKKIVIHGASSFLGKHFIEFLLNTNNMVIAIARETSKLRDYESTKNLVIMRYKESLKELMERSLIDLSGSIFYEFSWQGVFGTERNNPEQYTVNIPLMISSVEFAKYINVKHWIGIGSQAEYGNLAKKAQETDECKPTTLYSKSKLICSQITNDLCASFNIDYTWIRLFSPYGPDSNHDWLIPSLIKNMIQNKPVNTTLGKQRWDYLYIDDVVEALFRLPASKGLGIANLGSGKVVLIRDVINKIKELINSNSKINFGAIPYRTDQLMYMEADISKISNQLNWHPKTDLTSGLSKTIEYYRKVNEDDN